MSMSPNRRIAKVPAVVLLAAILAVAGTAAAGCTAVFSAESEAPPELIEPVGVPVHAVPAKRADMRQVWNGAGVVAPVHVEYVHFETDGRLARILVAPGDRVRKGQVLMQLETTDELTLLRQQLAVAQAESALAAAAGGGDEDALQIAQLTAEIEHRKLERMRRLQEQATLAAPIDGIVTFVEDIPPGGAVAAYRSVVGIARTDALQVIAFADLTGYADRMLVGMPVRLTVRGRTVDGVMAGAPWTLSAARGEGAEDRFAGHPDARSKTLLFDFADGADLPAGIAVGDYVSVTIVLAEKRDALVIPRGALRNDRGRLFVRIAEEDGSFRDMYVRPGMLTATQAEILEGIAEGQQVVVFP
jgi:multidrug efflux pump subunit AcrA (membrane-fusion protein)